jgi:levanase/fructan beta-fructosidase
MNDPNGLVFHAGEWHLFFQHNPVGDTWGNIAWGHAVSRDLLHWEQLDTALAPEGDELPFSGSAVVDGDALVAIYTAARPGNQSQALARSTDGGRTFVREGVVLDIGSPDFRDPKVFRFEDHWVMAVALAVERRVQLYRSPDLRSWTLSSEFFADVPGGVWECPDLFPLGDRWVLIVSVDPGTWAFVGDFDGVRFTAERVERLDHGPDFYAAVTFNNTPRRLLMAWMNSPAYAHGRAWRSAMTVVRELSLVDGRIVQRPLVPGVPLRPGETLEGVTHDGDVVSVERGGPPWFAGRFAAPADGPATVVAEPGFVEVFTGVATLAVQTLPSA